MIRPAILFTVPHNAGAKGRGGTRAIHSKGRVAIVVSLGIGLEDVTNCQRDHETPNIQQNLTFSSATSGGVSGFCSSAMVRKLDHERCQKRGNLNPTFGGARVGLNTLALYRDKQGSEARFLLCLLQQASTNFVVASPNVDALQLVFYWLTPIQGPTGRHSRFLRREHLLRGILRCRY